MKLKTDKVSLPQDWLTVGVRALLVHLLMVVFLVTDAQTSAVNPNFTAISAYIIGLIAVGVLALCIGVRPLNGLALSVALVCDWVIVAAFVAASGSSPQLLLLTISGVLLIGLLDFPFMWNVVQILGALGVGVTVLVLISATVAAGTALLIGIALGIVALATAYTLDQRVASWRHSAAELVAFRRQQTAMMRDRTRAIYDLAYAMSSTLKYEKVLDAALEAGYLGLNMSSNSGLIAGVLLFHADDNLLHLASARGFARTDDTRTLRGIDGVVGQALREVIPVFGTSAIKDPELNVFVGLQQARSLLVIPLCARFDNFGILIYASDKPNAFNDDHSDMLTAIGVHATIALQNALLYRELIEEKEKIVEVDEEARKKLARDLHDGATQTIAAIAMRMSYVYKLMEKRPDEVLPELKKIEELARKTTKEVRHLLFTLRPLVLETQGLTVALMQLAEKMKETYEQAVVVRADRNIETYLDHHQQGMIFYIVEEAINNARKHAQAPQINVKLQRTADSVLIEIKDNGSGFDISKISMNYDMRGSLGMVNMRERAELLHGTFAIDSSEGGGTTITLVIPFHAPDMTPVGGVPSLKRGMTKLALAAHNRDASKTGLMRP
ncbi:MAG: GAF domain-containing sensor histidine kinase [Chloroflexota bacterium]|nr:GAF domain-containing sensor histidine kinase [Chloroflexota bacterium]